MPVAQIVMLFAPSFLVIVVALFAHIHRRRSRLRELLRYLDSRTTHDQFIRMARQLDDDMRPHRP